MEGSIQTQIKFQKIFSLEGKLIVSQNQTVVTGKQIITIQIIILIDRSFAVVCVSLSGWPMQQYKVGSPGCDTEPCTSQKQVASTFGDWFY